MTEKKELRQKMLSKRNSLDKEQKEKWDDQLCEKLLEVIYKKQPGIVHTYLPMDSEINISPVIEELLKTGKTVVAPKALKQRKMQNLILQSLQELEEGIYGTRHPAMENEYQGTYDLIIIPGLAFDQQLNRLGYGSGYYDSFLVHQPGAYKLGICYPFQLLETIPIEKHDSRIDNICLPGKIH